MMRWMKSCTLFMLGWFAGCTFVMVVVMDPGTKPSLRGAVGAAARPALAADELSKYIEASTRAFVSTTGLLQPRLGVLPEWRALPENLTLPFPLYFYWSYDARLLSIYNYKVLESVLAYYPTATIIVHPLSGVDECNAPLSPHHFSKYSKRGYNIVLSNAEPQRLRGELGGDFWDRWMSTGCLVHNCTSPLSSDLLVQLQTREMRQPYFAEIYQQIIQLWKTGGIYNDFSYFLLGHLEGFNSKSEEGSYIRSTCGAKRSVRSLPNSCSRAAVSVRAPADAALRRPAAAGIKSWAYSHWSSGMEDSASGPARRSHKSSQCAISTMLVFRQPYSTTLDCVLRHYGHPVFQQCLAADLWVEDVIIANITGRAKYRWGSKQGADCVKQAFADCFLELKTDNILGQSSPKRVLEDFAENMNGAKYLVRNVSSDSKKTGWHIFPSTKIIWIGVDTKVAFGARLTSAENESISLNSSYQRNHTKFAIPADMLDNEATSVKIRVLAKSTVNDSVYAMPGSILAMATDRLKLKGIDGYTLSKSASSFCHPFSPSENDVDSKRVLGRGSCAPSVLIPGFFRSAGTFITNALTTHPNILPQLYGTGVYDTSSLGLTSRYNVRPESGHTMPIVPRSHCYPTLSLSVSTLLSSRWYFNHLLSLQMLSGNTSLTEEEINAYMKIWANVVSPDMVKELRKFCFPMIEASESFLSVHTDSSYLLEFDMPSLIRRDNPSIKVIFVIRDPVDRMYSHYKYLFAVAAAHLPANLTPSEIGERMQHIIPRFDVMVEMSTSRFGPMGKLREIFSYNSSAKASVTLQSVVTEYYAIVERTKLLYGLSPRDSCALIRRTKNHWKESNNITDYVDYAYNLGNGVIDRDTFRWLGTAAAPHIYHAVLENENDDIRCPLITGILSAGYELQLHSLYLPPILHYGSTLGMDHILVINSDDLNPENKRRFHRIMSAIYLFLGVPRFDITEIGFVKDDTVDTTIPITHQMSHQAHRRLKTFFSTFNEHLEVATGLNLSTWAHAMPLRDWPQQNALLNERDVRISGFHSILDSHFNYNLSSMPFLPVPWYDSGAPIQEVQEVHSSAFKLLWWLAGLRPAVSSGSKSDVNIPDGEDVPQSVVGYLDQGDGWKKHMDSMIEAFLPKGKLTETDVGFNTTIGMLSSF